MSEALSIAGLVIIIISLVGILASNNWRLTILLLSILYLGCFLLLLKSLPLVLAASKLIAGWIAGVILGMVLAGLSPEESKALGYSLTSKDSIFSSHRIFRLLLAGIVILVIISSINRFQEFVPGINDEQSYASAMMIGLSLILLSLISRPFEATVGLLILLSGFEILYTVVETSAVVIGLLTVVDLGLALAGAYLIVTPTIEKAV
jgi:hypothetical protein